MTDDIRTMLRAERANRRITHPNASYTSEGKLLCNLCSTMIKSEGAWGGHLHSTQHTLRLSRVQESVGAAAGGTKRKAERLESPVREEGRKRVKGGVDDEEEEESEGVDLEQKAVEGSNATATISSPERTNLPVLPPSSNQHINLDDELAAFERDIAALESKTNSTTSTAINPSATISAAPMTAEQVAAQAREELSAQRGKRDAEMAAEKEDAARVLEDEFEEMEGLEERVRRMRERREALRKGGGGEANITQTSSTPTKQKGTEVGGLEDEDEDDGDDYDDWGFGAD